MITRKSKYTKELLEPLVKKNISFRGVTRDLGLNVSAGGNAAYITRLIRGYKIDTSHMLGKSHGTTISRPKSYSLEEVMVKHSNYNRGHLKARLLKTGVLKNKCSKCGIEDWQEEPLIMVLDHINGVNDDNRQKNLRMLCPNCNSQQPTFCRKNKHP